MGETTLSTLLAQMEKAAQWADLIEIRLDKLLHLNLEIFQTIAQKAPCPLIWTLRKASQGGDFQGTEEERMDLLHALLTLQPTFVDLEGETPASIIQSLQQLSPCTKWIISWHALTDTPLNLEEMYQQLICHQATYYKMVTFAKVTTDALRMVNFALKHNREISKLCAFCMGELGQVSRILGPVVGHPFTFASLEKGKETATGQLTAQELVETYRFRDINRETQLLGLIGRPVDKSLSHLTHQAVLRHFCFNALYLKFDLQDSELSTFFEEINSWPIRGLSVTMPFKERVLAFLDYPHELVACNTLVWTSEGMQGHNTDGIGALKALGFASLHGKKIVILGAGGTAKAIAQLAHQQGAQLTILNRTPERAQELASLLQADWGGLDQLSHLAYKGYDCLIQATSVGMAPHIDETPIPVEWIAKEACVLDVISNPPETRLLREIRQRGGQAISGQELFIHQAVAQFVCWFGKEISPEKIEATMRHYLTSSLSVSVCKHRLQGSVTLPSSKSHTIRAILLAALTKGTSYLYHVLDSPDVTCALQVACQWGAKVQPLATGLAITGVAGEPQTPQQVLDAGNSGQVLRFASALSALSKGYTVMTGDASIRSQRSIQPLLEGLRGLHTWAISTQENGYAPLVVKGPLQAGVTHLQGQDSQPVSALLMAAAFIEGRTEIHVNQAGEKPWLALTLNWLERLGVHYQQRDLEHFIIQGQRIRPAFTFKVPGDLSALAFPLVAALITQSELEIHNVDMHDVQGDKEIVFLLQRMGAHIEIHSSFLKVYASGKLKGQVIDVNGFIDAVPILAVLGCYIEGETELINAANARRKESDRLHGITTELRKMGACIEETEDGLKVRHSSLKGAHVHSHGDHRLAMALVVAGLGAIGDTIVQDVECINKSYPTFLKDFN